MGEVDGGHLNFRSKYTYYGMDLFTLQPSVGVDYAKLLQTYQVTFCSYTVFPKMPDFVHEITLRFRNGELFCDKLNIVVIEMSKLDYALNKRVEELSDIEIWGLFFGYAQDPKYRKILNSIITTKKEVGMATELLMEISQNDVERARFMSRKKFQMDLTSDLITAKKQGELEGETRGKLEERQRNVLRMFQANFNVETIAKVLDLPEQDVNNILGI